MRKLMTGACWAPLVVAGLGEAAAGESRGWRPAAGFHGLGMGSVGARYSSPGLYPSDMASVVFHWSGNVPLRHFAAIAAGPGAKESALGVLDDPGIGEAVRGWTKECLSHLPGKASRQDLEACVGENAMDGAGFAVELLADIPDLAWARDRVERVEALGLHVEGPGRFLPIVEGVASGFCEGEEDKGLCAACLTDFRSLAAGEEPGACQRMPTEAPPKLCAISASFPLAAFLDARAEALSYGTDVRLAVQVCRRSGNWHAPNYVSDGLFDALFAPRD